MNFSFPVFEQQTVIHKVRQPYHRHNRNESITKIQYVSSRMIFQLNDTLPKWHVSLCYQFASIIRPPVYFCFFSSETTGSI